MPNNKITFGLRNVHYAIANQDNNGNWSFDTPVALQGAQEFSSEVVGGSTNVYADDTLYASLVQNAGRTLTLKFTEIPDEFKTAVQLQKQPNPKRIQLKQIVLLSTLLLDQSKLAMI